jgi:two-component system OmpR family sensor kinase
MHSLRARLIISVLALAGAGLVALGAVTYAEQRSFLLGRVDQEARSAVGAISQQLDSLGFLPAGAGHGASAAPDDDTIPGRGAGGQPGGGGAPFVNLPPGTWGQRRTASGEVIGKPVRIKYSESEALPPTPALPAKITVGKILTVGSYGSSGLHYRVYSKHDPEDSGITIVAVPLSDVDATLHRLLIVEALVIGGVLIALGLSAWFVVKAGLRPLDRIEVTADEIAAGELDRRVSPADPKTEVGRLGLALNAMLERLEQAFAARTQSEERLRQFLADASHELRTPLASIRGYAELFRMGAASGPKETESAMRRIEEESKRMGILVEDLLSLARLDEEPERDPVPLELAALAEDAVADARATAPDRAVSLEADGPAIVTGDPLQMRQVLANLLRNAILHTPPGTPIEVGVAEQPGWVTLSVRDHGPGIPAEARKKLFERFYRKEAGRERGRGGSGLGLAIVDGVVEAHGGSVTITDTPGGGATFEVRLPAGHSTAAAPGSGAAQS